MQKLSGFPDKPESLDAFAKYYGSDLRDGYNEAKSEAERRKIRDQIVGGRIEAVDKVFGELERTLFQSGVTMNIGADWAVLGLNAAASVVGGAGTKAALAATSGGIVGAKGSVDKNLFYEKTMPVLLSEMRASRKAVLARIRAGLTLDTNDYSLTAALSDVAEYFSTGSIPGAIAAVSANTGKTAKDAEAKLESTVTGKFVKDRATIALRKFWKPDGVNVIDANETKLADWMRGNGINTSITFFLFSNIFADARIKAVQDLKL
jgi:hypothetical protein